MLFWGHKHLLSLVYRLNLLVGTVDYSMDSWGTLWHSSQQTVWRAVCTERSRYSWFCRSASECRLSIRNQACSPSCCISMHERSCNGHSHAWTLWNQSWLCKRQSGCKGKAVLGYSASQPLPKLLVLKLRLTVVTIEELYSISSRVVVVARHTWDKGEADWKSEQCNRWEDQNPLHHSRAWLVFESIVRLRIVKRYISYIFESP